MASTAASRRPCTLCRGPAQTSKDHTDWQAKLTFRQVPYLDKWLQDPVGIMEALKAHAEGHAPPQTKLTFRKLPFHAQPYLMPRDTVANRAATKVLRFHSSSKLCARVLDQVSVVYCMLACQGGLQQGSASHGGHHAGCLYRHTVGHSSAQSYMCCRAADFSVAAVRQVLKELFQGPFYYREGGSIPALALIKEHLGIWCTSFGFGLSTDNLHSPNER